MESSAQVKVEDVAQVHQIHPGGGDPLETQLKNLFKKYIKLFTYFLLMVSFSMPPNFVSLKGSKMLNKK